MKFTDLNLDCLEIVLEYLNLIDLLNVADTNKRLNKAAELVFVREKIKHGSKYVTFGNTKILRDRSFKITREEIYIDDLKTSLQLLRCVGRVVSKIKFNKLRGMSRNQCEIDCQVATYINKYCTEHLNQFEFPNVFCPRIDMVMLTHIKFSKLTGLLDKKWEEMAKNRSKKRSMRRIEMLNCKPIIQSNSYNKKSYN